GPLRDKLPYYAKAPPSEAVALLATIARAVHYAHQQQILHRDLKPANVFIDETGAPRVGDFGLVKFLDETEPGDSTRRVMGTWAYMSPEQAAGLDEKLSPATDVWALGVILYEMLTGV